MAKAEQLEALSHLHAEGDDKRFYAVVMQVSVQVDLRGPDGGGVGICRVR